MDILKPTDGTGKTFRRLLLVGFVCVGTVNVLTHEMWRDELQAWQIARDSHSVGQLFANLRYEGHPGLWHGLLYLVSAVADRPLGMQLLHLAIAAGAVYVFLRFAPFGRLEKLLFTFGYFPLYEYATISRNYGLGVLLVFCFCAVWGSGIRNYLLQGFILFLLAQTSVHGLLLAVSLGVMVVFELVCQGRWRELSSRRKRQFAVGACVLGLGVIVSVLQLLPPADGDFASDWRTDVDIRYMKRVLGTVWKSYVPIPRLQFRYWNSNILRWGTAQPVLSAGLLCAVLICLRCKRAALFLFCLGTVAILAFCYGKYFGYLRHHGHLFVVLIASLWIARREPGEQDRRQFPDGLDDEPRVGKFQSYFLVALLSIHLAVGLGVSVAEWVLPFSASKATAAFIKDQRMDQMLIAGDVDHPASAVAGHLGRAIYYARGDRMGSFVIWDKKRSDTTIGGALVRMAEFAERENQDVLLVMNYELVSSQYPIVEIAKFPASVVPRERYCLYLISGEGMSQAR